MLFAFGYNGSKQLSSISDSPQKIENTPAIRLPLEINPRRALGAGHGTVPSDVSDKLKEVSICWDSIMFIYDDGCLLSGFRSALQPALRSTHVISGSLLWDSVVLVRDQGPCHVTSHGQETTFQEIELERPDGGESQKCTTRILSVSCGEKHQTFLTDHHSVLSLQKCDEGLLLKEVSLRAAIKQLSCGKEHVMLLSRIGAVFTYGMGTRGQLGHGDVECRSDPVCVEALQCVSGIQVSAGGWHSVVVSDLGDIYIWGWNEKGQLGFSCNSKQKDYVNILPEPRILDLETASEVRVSKISCGSRHTVAVTDEGVLYTWGWNQYGQLGHGDIVSRDKPARVTWFDQERMTVVDVFCGYWNTVVKVERKELGPAVETVRGATDKTTDPVLNRVQVSSNS